MFPKPVLFAHAVKALSRALALEQLGAAPESTKGWDLEQTIPPDAKVTIDESFSNLPERTAVFWFKLFLIFREVQLFSRIIIFALENDWSSNKQNSPVTLTCRVALEIVSEIVPLLTGTPKSELSNAGTSAGQEEGRSATGIAVWEKVLVVQVPKTVAEVPSKMSAAQVLSLSQE